MLPSYGLFIDYARVLERNFTELSYSHIKREDNKHKVAHCFARLALNLSDTDVWMEDTPPLAFLFVQGDLAFCLN